MKKLISVLLVVVMVSALFATAALAEENEPTNEPTVDDYAGMLGEFVDKINNRKGTVIRFVGAIADKKAAEEKNNQAIVLGVFNVVEKIAESINLDGFAHLFDQVGWMIKNIFRTVR